MILTQIELDQIKEQVRYEPETGHFFYTQDRLIPRRFKEVMAVPPLMKVAHKAGDRADKVYGGKFVGVYVLSKAISAAHIAVFLNTGDWPAAVKYKDGNWKNLKLENLTGMSRSEQTADAARARYAEHERALPPNVYANSNGTFIGKKGNQKTRHYKTVDEVISAMSRDRWLPMDSPIK